MDTILLILVLILLLYISVVYVMLQINMLEDSIDNQIIKSKKDTVEFVRDTVKIFNKEVEDFKTQTARLLSIAETKHASCYEKLSNRITNLSVKDTSKKTPVKELVR